MVWILKVSERGVVDLDLYTSCEFNIHGHSNLAIIKSSEEAEDTEVGGGGGGGESVGSAQRWFDHLLTPFGFDNSYFRNLMSQRDLLHSDQELFNGGSTVSIVREYSQNARVFRNDFAAAMVKMSHISPLTGTAGEIRRNCGRTN
ncbi:hypothetical protein YC2023_034060 [Brassica napus]